MLGCPRGRRNRFCNPDAQAHRGFDSHTQLHFDARLAQLVERQPSKLEANRFHRFESGISLHFSRGYGEIRITSVLQAEISGAGPDSSTITSGTPQRNLGVTARRDGPFTGYSSVGRAPRSGRGGRRIVTCYPDHFSCSLAQSVEHSPVKRGVLGSYPRGAATFTGS